MKKRMKWAVGAGGAAVAVGLVYAGIRFDFKAADWAAWVQALGSLIALAIAIGISAKGRADVRKDGQRTALGYIAQVYATFGQLKDACAKQDLQLLIARFEILRDTVQISYGVPFGVLAQAEAVAVLSTRAQVHGALAKGPISMGTISWQPWEVFFQGQVDEARERLDALRQSLGFHALAVN